MNDQDDVRPNSREEAGDARESDAPIGSSLYHWAMLPNITELGDIWQGGPMV